MCVYLERKDLKDFRKKLLEDNDFTCPICKKFIEPGKEVLDHCHQSGCIRNTICRSCNIFLGKIENNCRRFNISLEELPQVLRNMADYIDADQWPILHPNEKPKFILKKSSYNKLKKVYDGRAKFPDYPKSGKLTKKLERLFIEYDIDPEFY